MPNNKQDGNRFENAFCARLAKSGFWAIRIPSTAAGQPADVIACIDRTPWLIDCKVCANGVFTLSRIEPNQKSAMEMWLFRVHTEPYFALLDDNGAVWMLPYSIANYWQCKGKKSIHCGEDGMVLLEVWIREVTEIDGADWSDDNGH